MTNKFKDDVIGLCKFMSEHYPDEDFERQLINEDCLDDVFAYWASLTPHSLKKRIKVNAPKGIQKEFTYNLLELTKEESLAYEINKVYAMFKEHSSGKGIRGFRINYGLERCYQHIKKEDADEIAKLGDFMLYDYFNFANSDIRKYTREYGKKGCKRFEKFIEMTFGLSRTDLDLSKHDRSELAAMSFR